jgi:hypothetical protein
MYAPTASAVNIAAGPHTGERRRCQPPSDENLGRIAEVAPYWFTAGDHFADTGG